MIDGGIPNPLAVNLVSTFVDYVLDSNAVDRLMEMHLGEVRNSLRTTYLFPLSSLLHMNSYSLCKCFQFAADIHL